MTKFAPEWVRTSDPVIRSPVRYRWTTAPADGHCDNLIHDQISPRQSSQINPGVPERVSISCLTCGTRHDLHPNNWKPVICHS